jgi:class 3 adenylate cyclase
MDTLSAYIPIDRRQAMARGESLPDRGDGAAVMADVSGFTPLTEALARELGPQRGAEEITRYLNQVYDALIAEVDRYHGSVVGFSGDAITCWFDGDDGLRATTCAVQLQRAMAQFSHITLPSGPAVALALKVAIAVGAVRRFVVGDPNVQLLDVLAGATLDRLAAAEHLAQKGEVVLSAETAGRLQQHVVIAEWRADATGGQFAVLQSLTSPAAPQPWLEFVSSPELEQQVKHWLLAAVGERESSGQGAFLAELRPALAVFVRFGGIDYDDEAARQKLDDYVRWVQGVLTRYEGFLLQLTIGDKGSYLYAAFGAPLAHEDDAARAMAAAQTLRTPPRGLGFITMVQIGVSQGRMRAGPCGSLLRRTYGVMGDEVNVAARLMQVAARGQVIVTKRVADHATQRFRFRSLGEVSVKGKQEPIPIFELAETQAGSGDLADQDTGSAAPPLVVGRADERTILTAHFWKLLSAQASGLVMLSGEAGIGKTRLIEDLRAEARVLNVTTLSGAGDAIEKSTPYHAWRAVFSHCLGLDALPDEVEVRRQHVLAALEADAEALRVAPLLNAVLPLDLPDNELTAQMTGQVRADNTHALLTRLLQRLAATGPLLLLLEDVHWLDSASWALTLAVSRVVQPLLMVISTRPLSDPLPADYRQLLDNNPNLAQIKLDSMPADEISHLVCQRLGVSALPEQVQRLILQKAEGNPFFSEELAFALRDTGLITIAGGACRLAPNVDLKALTFPDTVQGVITSRIDRLTPSQQMTLKAASVVGRVFAYRILRDIHPIISDRAQLQQYLATLQHLDLTVLETPEPDLAYLFKHALTQEVAYNLMLFAQRRELHRAVGEWYERAFAEDLAPHYPLLAYHWNQAEDAPKAIEYMEKAGEQAMRSGASLEAISLFNRVLELAEAQPDRYDLIRRAYWERQIGEAYLGIGNVPEAQRYFVLAMKHLARPLPASPAGTALGIASALARQVVHRLWPARFIGRSRQRQVDFEISHIYLIVAQIAYYHNDKLTLLHHTLSNLNVAEGLGPSFELAAAYSGISIVCGVIPLRGLAEQYIRLTKQAAATLERSADIAQIEEYIGTYQAGLRLAAAAQCFDYAVRVFGEIGHQRLWEENATLLSMVLLPHGQIDRSLALREKLLAVGMERNSAQTRCWALLGLAEIALLRHELPAASDYLERAQALVEKIGLAETIWMYGLLARAQWRQGQIDLARVAAQQGAAIAAKATPANFFVLEGYAGIAEVALNLWEADAAAAPLARQAIKHLNRFAHTFPMSAARALLMQGRAAWLSGQHATARALWHKGLAAAEERQTPYDRGLVLDALGRYASPDDVARDDYVRQALHIFADLRATYDFDRARSEINRA